MVMPTNDKIATSADTASGVSSLDIRCLFAELLHFVIRSIERVGAVGLIVGSYLLAVAGSHEGTLDVFLWCHL